MLVSSVKSRLFPPCISCSLSFVRLSPPVLCRLSSSSSDSPSTPKPNRWKEYWTEDRRASLKLLNYSWPFLVLSTVLIYRDSQNPYDSEGNLKRNFSQEERKFRERMKIRTPK